MFRDDYRNDSVGELRRLERWFQAVCQRHPFVDKLCHVPRKAIGPLTLAIASIGLYLALTSA